MIFSVVEGEVKMLPARLIILTIAAAAMFCPTYSLNSVAAGIGAYAVGAGDVGEVHKSIDAIFLTRGSHFGASFNIQTAIDQSRSKKAIPINIVPGMLLFPSKNQFLLLNPYLSLGLSLNPMMIWPTLGLGLYIPTPWKAFLINAYALSGFVSSSVGISIGYVL